MPFVELSEEAHLLTWGVGSEELELLLPLPLSSAAAEVPSIRALLRTKPQQRNCVP